MESNEVGSNQTQTDDIKLHVMESNGMKRNAMESNVS
jgi:hypothetical protein